MVVVQPHRQQPGGPNHEHARSEACAVYAEAIRTLSVAQVPFLIGGGFAVEVYLGAPRKVIKDLDVFLKPEHLGTALAALTGAGFRTELYEPGWLAKAYKDGHFIDLIYATRNELLQVDQQSFEGAPSSEVLGLPVKLQPVEELIATKVFVAARDRFDVSDIVHLFLKCGDRIDWRRLIDRLAPHIEMLNVHLMLFRYVYPGRQDAIPQWVYEEIEERVRKARERGAVATAFRGLALDPVAFAVDIERWGFFDARKADIGGGTPPLPRQE